MTSLLLCKMGLCCSFIFVSHHFKSTCIINSINCTILTLGHFLYNFNLRLCYRNLRIDCQCSVAVRVCLMLSCAPFPTWTFKKAKVTQFYETGSVYSKQEEQKMSDY